MVQRPLKFRINLTVRKIWDIYIVEINIETQKVNHCDPSPIEIKLSLTLIRFIDLNVTKHINSKLLKVGLLLHRLSLDRHYLSQKRSCDWSVETKRYLLLVNF